MFRKGSSLFGYCRFEERTLGTLTNASGPSDIPTSYVIATYRERCVMILQMSHFFSPLTVACLLALLSSSCTGVPDNYAEAIINEVVDRNESIVATGYAVISIQKSSNPAQQRILSIRASKLDAYRTLLEQVYGQYLDANTTIAELIVKNDTFKARVQGVIYDARLVSISPVGNDTYETTLSLDKSVVDDLRKLYLKSMSRQTMSSRATARPAAT